MYNHFEIEQFVNMKTKEIAEDKRYIRITRKNKTPKRSFLELFFYDPREHKYD